MHLRLALATILNAKHGQFTLLAGIVCSSWTTINMATSGRTTEWPHGHLVIHSKKHFNYCILCWIYHVYLNCYTYPWLIYWVLENPSAKSHGIIAIYILYSCIVGPALLKLTPLRPRLALLIFVVEAMSGAWLVEQPSLSMLRFHPRIMDTFSFFEEPWLNLC